MAGVKGKSGGARANAGGKRAGAGRKPKEAAPESANGDTHSVTVGLEPQPHGGALKRSKAETQEIAERDMLTLLQDIALGRVEASNNQVRAAIAAVQYTHRKKGEGGKKEEDAANAKTASEGTFSTRRGPQLAVSNK